MKKITTLAEETDKVVKVVQPNAAPGASVEKWTYTRDAGGDWRGISSDGQRRTRLKATREWAVKDVAIGRLQYRRGDVWVDEIDGKQHRWTVPVARSDLEVACGREFV